MSHVLPGVGQCTPEMAHAMSRLDGYDHDRDMPGLQRWMDYWDAAVLAAPALAPQGDLTALMREVLVMALRHWDPKTIHEHVARGYVIRRCEEALAALEKQS